MQDIFTNFLPFCIFLNFHLFREAFKIFDRDKDGYISMKELKKVTSMLGTVLTKEEIEEFMAEADVVRVEAFEDNLTDNFLFRMEMANWTMMNLSRCCSNIKFMILLLIVQH